MGIVGSIFGSIFQFFTGLRPMAALLLLMGVMSVGFFLYYNYTKNEMIALRANNAILQTAVDEQKKTIDAINAFDKAQAARINELQSNLSAAEDERKKLEDQFAQQNLNEGAIKDPKAIEDIINQTTADQFKQIEADTGAKSTTTPPVKKPACSAHLPAVLCKSK